MANGKVDLAVINTKLEYIQSDLGTIKQTLDEINKITDRHESRLTSVETKIGILGAISIAFTTLSASIAAWLGVKN